MQGEVLKLAENVTGASVVPALSAIGGRYKLFPSGTVGTSQIEQQGPHGEWFLVGVALVTATVQDLFLVPGAVRANLGSAASAAYVYLVRVPQD